MNKILFLDIDGPMIPGRAYLLPNQPFIVQLFDPVAVSLVNHLCEERDWKIVLHSTWIKLYGGQHTKDHCISQGIKAEHFHEDSFCDEAENWRYTRVAKWLKDHPECNQYAIIDDIPYSVDVESHYPHPKDLEEHLLVVDFEDGLLLKHYRKLHDDLWCSVLEQ